jgi:hypothetical protein
MKQNIIVIVKNKLITIDTVLPVLIEMKEKYGIDSTIVVNDELAHKGIKENVVIRDAVNYVGKEIYVGDISENKIIRKSVKIGWLVVLLFKMFFGVKILHFGTLEVFPYSILNKLFRRNIFLLQSSSYSYYGGDFNSLLERSSPIVKPISGNVVLFNDNISAFSLMDYDHNVYNFGGTRIRKSWFDYVNARSDFYFSLYHNNVDTSRGCIVLILAFFGKMEKINDPYDGYRILFKKTIGALQSIKGDIPVLLKPHVFTDMNIVNNEIQDKNGFYITYLHPSVLATRAKFFVCNLYSTTMADAKSFGVKTIEYSDYRKDLLELLNGNSIGEHIDIFINNDQIKFESEMRKILKYAGLTHCDGAVKKENHAESNEFLDALAK